MASGLSRFTRATIALAAVAVAIACGRTESDDLGLGPDGGGGTAASAGTGGGVGGATGGIGGATGGVGGSTGGVGGATGGSAGVGGTGGKPGCGPCDGCCDAAGQCRPGLAINACGLGGVECLDCGKLGFDCAGGQCQGKPPPCGPGTCDGCCDAAGLCRFGTESDACGVKGGACDNCAAKGQGCSAGVCQGTPPKCGPANCGGCCDAQGNCQPGSAATVCGSGGQACSNCSAQSKVCISPGNYCGFLPTCGAATCATGCCDAQGICRTDKTDGACGSNGQKCADCKASGQTCAPQGFCYNGPSCGSASCGGCCTANGNCLAGSTNLACGQYGTLCDNCSAKGQNCIGQVCGTTSTCPAPYAGCSPGSITPPPVAKKACSGAELSSLASGCSGGDCGQAFQKLLQSNPGCYDCMLQFVADDAYARCLAPFLGENCNHQLTCAVQCGNTSCGQCSPSQEDACQDKAFGSGGACQPYVFGYYCAQAALSGPGAFCNWTGDVGSWIKSVGGYYCGN